MRNRMEREEREVMKGVDCKDVQVHVLYMCIHVHVCTFLEMVVIQ